MNDIFSTLAVVLSAIATCGMFIVAYKQKKFLEKLERQKMLPYLYPIEHKFSKEKWIRYYEGIDLNDVVPKKHFKELTIEQQNYCLHAKEHEGETYFYTLDGELILVINGIHSNRYKLNIIMQQLD